MGIDEFCVYAWKFAAADADGVDFDSAQPTVYKYFLCEMVTYLKNEILLFDNRLRLLDDKALYLPDEEALLVSDVHLGKAETFQSFGIPIPNQMNEENLDRLRSRSANKPILKSYSS